MKQLVLPLTFTLSSLACQTQPEQAPQSPTVHNPYLPDATHLSLVEVPLSAKSFCTDPDSLACFRQAIQLQREVARYYPIPIPQPNTPPPLSADEATALYKQYVADHAGQPILAVFQQLYARILLNKYGLLAQKNLPQIRYFTEQMLESRSQDVVTLTSALTILRGTVSANQYTQWLNRVIAEAEQRQRHEETYLLKLKEKIGRLQTEQAIDSTRQRFMLKGGQQILTSMEKKLQIKADALTRLRQLRDG